MNEGLKITVDNRALQKIAIRLSWFTIGYNILEGIASLYFGLEKDSVALMGFGADSFIEVASAVAVLWRFKGEAGLSARISISSERVSTRIIGWLFVLLSAGTIAGSGFRLFQHAGPGTTIPGVIISLLSLSFMFYLWSAKKNVARALNSATVEKDADCSLACIKLSVVLLAGSAFYALSPSLWWGDSVSALVIAFLIGREGVETIRAAGREDFSGGCGCGCAHDPE